jgi:hypothetical protein
LRRPFQPLLLQQLKPSSHPPLVLLQQKRIIRKRREGKKKPFIILKLQGITTPGSQDTEIGVDAVLELLTPGCQLRRRTPANYTEKSDSSPELGALGRNKRATPGKRIKKE